MVIKDAGPDGGGDDLVRVNRMLGVDRILEAEEEGAGPKD
jgi:hypothetical protein